MENPDEPTALDYKGVKTNYWASRSVLRVVSEMIVIKDLKLPAGDYNTCHHKWQKLEEVKHQLLSY